MAQFYGSMQGNRGGTTRMGSKDSGIQAHVRGWNVGVQAFVYHEDGVDVCRVYKTSGSTGSAPSELVMEFTEHDVRYLNQDFITGKG